MLKYSHMTKAVIEDYVQLMLITKITGFAYTPIIKLGARTCLSESQHIIISHTDRSVLKFVKRMMKACVSV